MKPSDSFTETTGTNEKMQDNSLENQPHPSRGDEAAFVAIAPLYDRLMHTVPYTNWIVYLHQLLQERHARPRHILDQDGFAKRDPHPLGQNPHHDIGRTARRKRHHDGNGMRREIVRKRAAAECR